MTESLLHPEDLSRADIRERQWSRLSEMLEELSGRNAFWTNRFQNTRFHLSDVKSLEDLSLLPLTTKAHLVADHEAHQPYGSNLTYDLPNYTRMHQTSGTTGHPMRWLDTAASWDWFMECWAQIYRIVGLTEEDRVCCPFSFGPFIGFWAAFEGANRLGRLCLAGGGMTSQARLKMIEDNQATIVCCTPTYALRLAEVAQEEKIDLANGPVRALVVAGEPGGSIPAIQQKIAKAWGARLFDHWGMTEIGSLAVECADNPGGLHILETECIAEIIHPKSKQPVELGEVGELVITNLGRWGSPLIRYRTGDLVQADTEPCSCGRQLLRLKGGIIGRADDMITIRGNNVFPTSVEAILREYSGIAEYRIIVETVRSMQHLRIEIEPAQNSTVSQTADELLKSVSRAIKDRLNFQAEIQFVAAGSLPRFELKGRRFIRK